MIRILLFAGLGIVLLIYGGALLYGIAEARRRRLAGQGAGGQPIVPTPFQTAIGFVTAFFDTLGIGSYATTTSIFKLKEMVPVQLIPGTLNVGHTLPTITQAFIYTRLIPVDPKTLVLMIASACLGSWLGAGVVVRWPRRKIQIGMGLALVGAAVLMLMTELNLFPGGGDTLGLSGVRLGIGLAGNFVLGVLMMLGIGLYAPCMILVSLLGMNPTAAFPIMMGSCAFLMPIASMKFVRSGSFDLRPTLGLALGSVPAVLIAALVIKSLPLGAVRWLVVAVVVYTAFNMLTTARGDEEAVPEAAPALATGSRLAVK
ncbi:MAG: permease [Betaproteobacteria bacterium]